MQNFLWRRGIITIKHNILNNQTVLISGGCGRIGSTFARAIVENGGNVIIGDINDNNGKKLVFELGDKASLFLKSDLVNPENIDSIIRKGVNKFGRIDAAIHCAYPTTDQWGSSFEDLQPENLSKDLFNQLGGAILFSQRIINFFRRQGYGNLLHISSIQGISAPKFEHYIGTSMISPIEYSAIKAGIISITRYLSKYCKRENIRVNCISPGGIFDNQPDSFVKNYNESCQNKGMLDAEDLIGTLLFLLSKQSEFITGQNIIVDDGWSL